MQEDDVMEGLERNRGTKTRKTVVGVAEGKIIVRGSSCV